MACKHSGNWILYKGDYNLFIGDNVITFMENSVPWVLACYSWAMPAMVHWDTFPPWLPRVQFFVQNHPLEADAYEWCYALLVVRARKEEEKLTLELHKVWQRLCAVAFPNTFVFCDGSCGSSVIAIHELCSVYYFASFYVASVLWRCWLGGRKSIRPVKTEWWGAGMVVCLERGANDLHMVQLMPLPPHHILLQ